MPDTYTPNLSLKKPGYDSPADIKDLNDNFDKIDTSVNQLSEQMVNYRTAETLLDNSDFCIAQAGYGGLHGNTKYAADRWTFVGTSVEKLSETGGIRVTGSQWSAKVRQFIPNPTSYIGKTLTFATRMRSSNLAQGYIAILTMKENGAYVEGYTTFYPVLTSEWETFVVRCTIPAGTEKIAVAFDNPVAGSSASNSYDIDWAVLYEGSYTAETLPPYVPKGYAAEMVQCQYYANVIEISAYGRAGLCKTTQGENACIWMINTPPMRPGGVVSVSMLEGTVENLAVEFNQLVATGISGFGVQSGNAHNILVNLSGNATASIVEPLKNRTNKTLKILISRDL